MAVLLGSTLAETARLGSRILRAMLSTPCCETGFGDDFVERGGIILETAVEREKAVQEIYVHREFLKLVVTLWVIRDFKTLVSG